MQGSGIIAAIKKLQNKILRNGKCPVNESGDHSSRAV
jgi:hypothetical protein